MPNWCESDLYVYGPDLDAVREFVTSVDPNNPGEEARAFDFHKIIPMPDAVRNTESSSDVRYGMIILGKSNRDIPSMLAYDWVKERGVTTQEGLIELLREMHPKAEDAARRSLKAYEETGYADWYEWSNANWGTKWNASRARVEAQTTAKGTPRLKFMFETAWGPPEPVIDSLARRFPKNVFSHRFYEMGMAFKGRHLYRNGRMVNRERGPYGGKRGG